MRAEMQISPGRAGGYLHHWGGGWRTGGFFTRPVLPRREDNGFLGECPAESQPRIKVIAGHERTCDAPAYVWNDLSMAH